MDERLPQYLHKPVQILWFASDEFVLVITTIFVATIIGGMLGWVLVAGSVRISVCGRAVDHQAAMALMKRSPKITANCAFAMVHSRGGIFHSFSDRFKIR